MRRIIIIDEKIQEPVRLSASINSHVKEYDIECRCEVRVPDSVGDVDVAFVHVNNQGSRAFIGRNADQIKEIYLASTNPLPRQRDAFKGLRNVKLFNLPIFNEEGWRSLGWSVACSQWGEEEEFPAISLNMAVSPLSVLRGEILNPLVCLHLLLQVLHKSKGLPKEELSDEEKASCRAGARLLEGNGQNLKQKFAELLGMTSEPGAVGVKLELQRELEEGLLRYSQKLYSTLLKLVSDEAPTVFTENLGEMISEIELLSTIVENGVAWREAVKTNSIFRHELKNAIIRLSLFIAPLSLQKREALKKELRDLHSALGLCVSTRLHESLRNEARERVNEALKYIKDSLENIQQGCDDSSTMNLREKLVKCLRQIIELTIQVAPRGPQ